MRLWKQCLTATLCLTLSYTSLAALPIADSQHKPLPTLAPLIKKISPAVVSISVKSTHSLQQNPLLNDPFFRHFFNIPKNHRPQQHQVQSVGSGVIVNAKDGTIITNHHVIKNADEIHIHLADGRSFEAQLIGVDPEADIAILKIKAKDLSAVKIANSDNSEVGDFVVAVGNPFGLGQTVTTGVVSALGRSGLGIKGYENFIQTDASINPGNSGGALLNLRGELVGINTAIIAPAGGNVGIGFAIPSNMAMSSLEQILEFGEVRRGRLGIYIQDLNPGLNEAFDLDKNQKGVLITKVQEGGSADKAGLKEADIITEINNKKVKNASELRNAIGLKRIGEKIKVDFIRDGKHKTLKVNIAASDERLADSKPGASSFKKLKGAEFKNTDHGVVVASIKPGSAAAQTGLKTEDIIIEANRIPVKKLKDLDRAIKHRRDDKLLLRIIRHNIVLYLAIR
ncbi:MAG: DegQ family serine endoprotease [Pseudomonadales bacterium]|nr:DegQ family serine endoprotease [Pseudomonadales bacterium]